MTLRAAITGEVATTIEDSAGDSHDVRVRSARGPAPLRRGPARSARADRQGRRPRRQDPGPPRRGRDGGPRQRAVHDPPQGPAARGADLGHELRPQPGRGLRRHRERGARAEAPPRLRRPARRRRRGAEEHVLEHGPDARPRRHLHLPDPGLPVRLVLPPVCDHAVAAPLPRGRRPRPARHRRHPQHDEHDRSHHAHGPRDEERHSPGGLRESGASAGDGTQRSPHQGRLDAPPAHRHDDAGHDLRDASPGVRHRRRRRDARPDGAGGHRRAHHVDAPDAGRRAGRLHVPRRPAPGDVHRLADRASASARRPES